MKKITFVFLLLLFGQLSFGQSLPDFSSLKLEKREDFNAAANEAALQAANYILSSPVDNKNNDRLLSVVYVIKWMEGTPEYSFTFGGSELKFIKKNDDLLPLYMAAMVKYVLENKADSKDQSKIKLNASKMVIIYSKDPKNNVKITKELKKMMEADDKGTLAEYLQS
jgi:hypothetical protein